MKSNKELVIAVLSLIVGICSCVGAYLALPQVQDAFESIAKKQLTSALEPTPSLQSPTSIVVLTTLPQSTASMTLPTLTPTRAPLAMTPTHPSPTATPTFVRTLSPSPNPVLTPAIDSMVAFCQAIQKSFPQTLDEIKRKFNLPDTKTGEFKFVTELCPGIASGFWIHDAVTEVQISVPPNGCIDSWAGDTTYVGDVGTPVPDGFGGWRVFKGTVQTTGMTYRALGCARYGVLGQGEQQTSAASPGVCALFFYPFGGQEKTFVFRNNGFALVQNYNGTLSCWGTAPSAKDVGGHPFAELGEVQKAGVVILGNVTPIDPNVLQ